MKRSYFLLLTYDLSKIWSQGYWQGLASSTRFDGLTLEECIVTMHQELTRCWNFNDPDDVRISSLNLLSSHRKPGIL
jgi:hypothetical protein